MSFVVEVIADDSNKWCANRLRFTDENEALGYGRDLANRWTRVRQWRVSNSKDPVNARWAGRRLVFLEGPAHGTAA